MSVDWTRIDRWHRQMAMGEVEEIRQVFAAEGARGPTIRWSPPLDEVAWAPLKFAYEYWQRAVAALGRPATKLVDPVELKPALGYLLLVDTIDGGQDFSYRVFGSIVSSVSDFDMTGRRISDHSASPYIREFFIALYRAAVERREPVWSHHGPALSERTAAWERIIMPLVDDSDRVARLLVGIIPIGLDGRPMRG